MASKRLSVEKIKSSILERLETNYACGIQEATKEQIYAALSGTVRDEIMRSRAASRGVRKKTGARKLYYLSAEFLVGRALHNNMVNLLNEANYAQALTELGISKDIYDEEPEPGLGNGGLGRLAACFLDSLSTLDLPAMGCTIRYEYGLFRQKIVDGFQVEVPDNWLEDGNVWELPRPEETVEVHFGGKVEPYEEHGRTCFRHTDYRTVLAVPYDIPCLGYDTDMVNMLRVWAARSPKPLDMETFNAGQFVRAMQEREMAEVISKVLYPNDNSPQGRELRLQQQYFFSSASVQYAVYDFIKVHGKNWAIFPEKVAFHVNDTHPGIAIPELMRILMDEHGLGWEEAESIAKRSFTYTNHTVMPEALEKWPVDLMKNQLPRIYMILEEMNRRLCERLWNYFPGQWNRIGNMAIIAYDRVHMANLCISHSRVVNGVSAIHTDILKKQTFRDYHLLRPNKFVSITNGITHRRWLLDSNPALTSLIDSAIGTAWKKDTLKLKELVPFADDAAFREEFMKVKRANKVRLAEYVKRAQGIELDTDSIFDVQAKRLHEYKRQLMNALEVLCRINFIKDHPDYSGPSTTYLFGAKASPGYERAKLIIKFINSVAEYARKDPRVSRFVSIVFLENYCVSLAEILMPSADVSEQISTAGKEASGTGNMKFMMNGAVTIGTMDGANCEIYDEVGKDNIYIFGMSAEEVEQSYSTYRSSLIYETDTGIRRALEQMIDGSLEPGAPGMFRELYHALLFGDGGLPDPYFVLKDMASYRIARRQLRTDYADEAVWSKKCVMNTACSGIFSSDRTIREYNEKVWHLTPLELA